MADSGGPQRHTLCFLSTLLSQKVPEKSDTVLRCIISGQPKPEVTWYKNGRTIEEGSIVSSYEFFENQYIHVLHLYCCTPNDTAVYQISAKNCFGMICCSASIEVKCSSENTQLSPDPKDDGDTSGGRETQACEQKSTDQMDRKEPPSKKEESLPLGTPRSADSSASECNPLCSLQLLASNDVNSSSSEKPLDAKGTGQTEEGGGPNGTGEIADGLPFPNSSSSPDKQDVYCHGMAQSESSKLTDGALNKDEDLSSDHQDHKAQKYISVSLPLLGTAAAIHPGAQATIDEHVSPPVSGKDSDSDSVYELCPEITLTYTEEFSDDDLEYLECSDVMTDYSTAVWHRHLEGPECVFLLESDDEEMEFRKCCLGEREPFLSEMGCGPWVSGDTGPIEASAGFCGDHSQSQEVRVRRHHASTHGPPSPQTGMTRTLGPHQNGTSVLTDPGTYKLPTASAEDDYPGIQGETRDSHQAGEEFTSDNRLAMDEAVTERGAKRLSGELEESGRHQHLQSTAEERAGGEGVCSKRGSGKPAPTRRAGVQGQPKQPSPNLKGSAGEGALNHLGPKEPDEHPETQSDQRESSHAKAAAPDPNSWFCTEGTVPAQAEQEARGLQTPPGTLPQRAWPNLEGDGRQVHNLFDTSWVPDQSDHAQVRLQETVGETLFPSWVPAFSEPAREEAAFTGTTTDAFPNLGGLDEENASLTRHLETESCTQSPQREENQDREVNMPGHSWEDQGQGKNLPDVNHAAMSPCEPSVCLSREGGSVPGEPEALSVASLAPVNIVPSLETVCHRPESGEAECLMERLEAGIQGTCDPRDSPVGAPVHKYLPQEICSTDLELAEGQSKVSALHFPEDETMAVVCQTQGSEPPQPTGEGHKEGNSAVLPPPSNTLSWTISQKASDSATGGHLAKVEKSTSRSASTGQEQPSLSISGGLEEGQPPSSENSSGWAKGEDSPSASALDTTDMPTSQSSVVKFPQETPTTLTANLECRQVTKESGDTPTLIIATQVHPAKYLPASVAEKSHADGPEESSPQAPDGDICHLPSNVQPGLILNGSTTKSPRKFCVAPSGPGVHACVSLPPEGDSCSNFLPQTDNQSGDKSQTLDRADNTGPEENVQEKGSERTQRIPQESLSLQGSLSEDNARESWPLTSAAQGETAPGPADRSSADSREERTQSPGLGAGVSMAQAPVEDDSLPPSNNLLEQSTESGPGRWKAGNKPKVIILEASVSEAWPPRQLTGSECKESEAGATAPNRVWAVADMLKAGATGPELDPSERTALAGSPQGESGSALANHREIHKEEGPVRRTKWSCLSSQYLNQPRFLESSVDPVDEKYLCVTSLPSESSKTRGQENGNNVSQTQLSLEHPAFFKQSLSCPQILESSVDPIDETGLVEWAGAQTREPSESPLRGVREDSEWNDGNLGRRVEVPPALSPVPCPQQSGETIPSENSTNRNQEASVGREAEQGQCAEAKVEVQPAVMQVPHLDECGDTIPRGLSRSQEPECLERGSGEAEPGKNNGADFVCPPSPLPSGLAVTTQASVGVDTHNTAGQVCDVSENHLVETREPQHALWDSKERGERERESGKHLPSPRGLPQLPFTSPPEGNTTHSSVSHTIEEPDTEVPQSGDTNPASAPGSPAVMWASVSGERGAEVAPMTLPDPCQRDPTLGRVRKPRQGRPTAAKTGRPPVPALEEVTKGQETSGSGHLAEGVKKKILSKVAALRLRLEERENARKKLNFPKKIPKLETSVPRTDEKKDPKKPPCHREGKAPELLRKIQAEMFPDHTGNVRLSCQFAEIHEDSTICWTKDSKSIAQAQRSAGDNSAVSLTIVQADQKDQGLYHCCLKNSYGRATADFNLTAEVLQQLSSHQDIKGCEEIEFSQLIFREDFLHDSYFGDRLRGQIATEELHFGEGVHRKAFRSKVMQGLMPVFQPGHACVLKVHNAVAYGTRNNDELVQKNYKLAAQECYVQNTARYYAKIYAAEAQPLEGFGEVPEIIPIFLIHRPEHNIPYATVEEELIGEFVKYSIRDGKEINFLRRESEAGQKCCTFQHWVYQKTSGGLLVTDMQGVGMKLTDVGIATLAKGYKGFKGNCSMTFIDQFKALHQCNKYCKMLGLKSLQNNNQKQKKPSVTKSKSQPNSTAAKKTVSGTPAEKKT
ncbi:alpha-protein kinase 2 isoform X1 [Saccopteryx leptura]|uniref:alpha-protein kinase 2 isoform X1 n=1 Tax=Saccopteryx leptura TaxID=249018 RepID=UPI00339C3F35